MHGVWLFEPSVHTLVHLRGPTRVATEALAGRLALRRMWQSLCLMEVIVQVVCLRDQRLEVHMWHVELGLSHILQSHGLPEATPLVIWVWGPKVSRPWAARMEYRRH